MLSFQNSPTRIARAVVLDASDFLLKGSTREAIFAALLAAAAGKSPSSAGELGRVAEMMNNRQTIDDGENRKLRPYSKKTAKPMVGRSCIAVLIAGLVWLPSWASELRHRAISNAQAVAGTWVLQQVSSVQELERLLPQTIEPALQTPGIRGFCLRAPWKAIDEDFSLLEAGLKLSRQHHVAFSVRFMAGRHTPERVSEQGCRFYLLPPGRQGSQSQKVPVPFLADGSPNILFEREYEAFVGRLAQWCRGRGVRLLHLAWYGQEWAELNHGKEVRAVAGYSYPRWLESHKRLLDIGLKHAGPDLAVELPFSGYGPLADAAAALADHVVQKIGPNDCRFFCQANGWGPNGDWGAPDAAIEAAFDHVWERPICRGQQAIQPQDYDWTKMFEKLYQNRCTYCEIYAPSFTMPRREQLVREIQRFADHGRRNDASLPVEASK